MFILFICGALFGAWWRVERAIAAAKAEMAATVTAAKQEASGQVNAAAAIASLTQVQLAEHKLHVAETYITKTGMRETRDEIMTGIKGLSERQDLMNQRMDNIVGSMLEQPSATKPRRSRSAS
ncbi:MULTISPECIES: hypothetical protein [Mesorhizobium]|uniref:hypothetical protein n=1 Tax=Mesorhizobium TaxID=68287 RepID=UPI0010A94E70|nr:MULTISPECIES: hypothetical protein [Mesorhizobium]